MTTPAPLYTRRLSDKIVLAIHQAIEQEALAVAEHLIRALELALTSEGGADKSDRRKDFEYIIEAYDRLRRAQRQ